MPCRDYYDDHPEQFFKDVTEPALKAQISFAESSLCASLQALETLSRNTNATAGSKMARDFYDWIDFADAGITKQELVKWHKNHKKVDDALRAQEAAEKLRETALSKLTPEEKAALGVK